MLNHGVTDQNGNFAGCNGYQQLVHGCKQTRPLHKDESEIIELENEISELFEGVG